MTSWTHAASFQGPPPICSDYSRCLPRSPSLTPTHQQYFQFLFKDCAKSYCGLEVISFPERFSSKYSLNIFLLPSLSPPNTHTPLSRGIFPETEWSGYLWFALSIFVHTPSLLACLVLGVEDSVLASQESANQEENTDSFITHVSPEHPLGSRPWRESNSGLLFKHKHMKKCMALEQSNFPAPELSGVL